jgi:hypothetical protein
MFDMSDRGSLDELAGGGEVAEGGGEVQRGPALRVGRIDVGV